jgi:hypothetical protein
MDGGFAHSPFVLGYIAVSVVCAAGFSIAAVLARTSQRRRAYLAAIFALWFAPIQFVNSPSNGFVPAVGAILAAPFSPWWTTALAVASLVVTWVLGLLVLSAIRFRSTDAHESRHD